MRSDSLLPQTSMTLRKRIYLSPRVYQEGLSSQNPQDAWNGSIKGSKIKSYQWTDQENKKYYHFLVKLKQKGLLTAYGAKIRKINVQMSRQVGSRSSVQCRSHNQKMLKRLGSLDAIITYFSQYFAKKAACESSTISSSMAQSLDQQEFKPKLEQQTRPRVAFLWPPTEWDIRCSLNSGSALAVFNF